MEYYWIISAVVALLNGVIFGFVTKTINNNKGYDGGFAWGFFLGVIGIIVVACKTNLNQGSSRSSYSNAQIQNMIREEVRKEVERVLQEEKHRFLPAQDTVESASAAEAADTQTTDRLEAFLEQAATCKRVAEVLALWEKNPPCENEDVRRILKEQETLERMYGVSSIPKTIIKIKELLS